MESYGNLVGNLVNASIEQLLFGTLAYRNRRTIAQRRVCKNDGYSTLGNLKMAERAKLEKYMERVQ